MFEADRASNAQSCRNKARTCGSLAVHARSPADRDQLQRMRDGWLSRAAANEDRPADLPPLPPVNSNALRHHA